ncbi:MAG: hypothetical protein EBX37_19115 [Alphaproteobacteria bacterium]|nr:hypothetical protein [Alphaproteobacteria bacterium]
MEDIQNLLQRSIDFTFKMNKYTPAVDVIMSLDGLCFLYPTKELIDVLTMDDDQREVMIDKLAYQYGYNAFIDAVRTATSKEQVLRKWIHLVAVDKYMFGQKSINTFHVYMFPWLALE